MFKTVFNTSGYPVVLDNEGRQLSPSEFGSANTLEQPAKDAIESGSLLIVDEVADDSSEQARAAAAQTALLQDRSDALTGMDKKNLQALASSAGILDADTLDKHNLVHALSLRTDVDLPSSKAAPAAETIEGK